MSSEKISIESKIKALPKDPGVYRFLNKDNIIIYIGKAKNLKNRVKSYFLKSKNASPKHLSLVKHIYDFEWIIVGSEIEALITEANLIKQHKPKYNIRLKDDKSFPFIKITREPFPQVLIVRNILKDGSAYYGPFTDAYRLRKTIKSLFKVFQIRSCSYTLDKKTIIEKKVSLCLDYHIKKCEGPCQGLITEEHYNRMIKRIDLFMRGKTSETIKYINIQMEKAANDFRFEDAVIYRDQIEAINFFKNSQSKVEAEFGDRDVFALSKNKNFGIVVILRIRNGRIFSREKISLENIYSDDNQILYSVMTNFYMDSYLIPRTISLPIEPSDEEQLLIWLNKKTDFKVKFSYPKKGEKAKELRITGKNADLLLGEWIINKQKLKNAIPQSLITLRKHLNLENIPSHIDGFDISHLGGTNTVASKVSFVDGRPRKNMYRKFNIKSVKGIDDYASMIEVLTRHYSRCIKEDLVLPDLILIDGGKGQLSSACEAMNNLGLKDIPIIGLAKRLEQVYLPKRSDPQSIPKDSPGLLLLRRVRDESHRFAISFQRKKRSKDIIKSVFHNIKGMGVNRTKLLFNKYHDLKEISNLSALKINTDTKIPLNIAAEIIKIAKNI